jgi:hypothetical protein
MDGGGIGRTVRIPQLTASSRYTGSKQRQTKQ